MTWTQLATKGIQHYQQFSQTNAFRKQQGLHDYSLLNALLKKEDEVRLHSRFIFSMINPNAPHYQGNLFLKTFLQQLPPPLNDFIDIEAAEVRLEEENIDLLISDGTRFMIIENKVRAVDQKYQITRYIQKIQQRLSLDEKADITDKIAVIYLSKSKRKPSTESQSLIGFEYDADNHQIVWQDNLSHEHKDKIDLKLSEGVSLPFYHFSYFPMLEQWVTDSILQIAQVPDLKFAFEEYQKILQRLKPNNPWKNIMTFEEYVLAQPNDEQNDLYNLMVQSNHALTKFVAKKLYQALLEMFDEETLSNHADFKPLTEASILKWLNKTGKEIDWKNIGFQWQDQNEKTYFLVLGVVYAYVQPSGTQLPNPKIAIGRKTARKLLLETENGLQTFIQAVQDMKTLSETL